MKLLEIKTLIDITNTNVRRINQGNHLELNQFRNWTTLLQCIGLRAIIDYDKNPLCEKVDIAGLGFGTVYKGKHNVWTFHFTPDQEDAFFNGNDPIGLLKNDLDKVPVIVNLCETINIDKAAFIVNDVKFANIVAKSL
jgi:hypothetical protein